MIKITLKHGEINNKHGEIDNKHGEIDKSYPISSCFELCTPKSSLKSELWPEPHKPHASWHHGTKFKLPFLQVLGAYFYILTDIICNIISDVITFISSENYSYALKPQNDIL